MYYLLIAKFCGVGFGLASAVYWWRSAAVEIPKEVPFDQWIEPVTTRYGPGKDQIYTTTRGDAENLTPIVLAYREQSRLNQIAATLTGVTILLQGITVVFGG